MITWLQIEYDGSVLTLSEVRCGIKVCEALQSLLLFLDCESDFEFVSDDIALNILSIVLLAEDIHHLEFFLIKGDIWHLIELVIFEYVDLKIVRTSLFLDH